MNKREKLKQLAYYHSKFLEDGLMQNVVEHIRYIHLKHHLIKVEIQSNLNTMDQCLKTTLNHHIKLMQQHVKRKHIMKLKNKTLLTNQ
jgi:RNA-binding protein YhbY